MNMLNYYIYKGEICKNILKTYNLLSPQSKDYRNLLKKLHTYSIDMHNEFKKNDSGFYDHELLIVECSKEVINCIKTHLKCAYGVTIDEECYESKLVPSFDVLNYKNDDNKLDVKKILDKLINDITYEIFAYYDNKIISTDFGNNKE